MPLEVSRSLANSSRPQSHSGISFSRLPYFAWPSHLSTCASLPHSFIVICHGTLCLIWLPRTAQSSWGYLICLPWAGFPYAWQTVPTWLIGEWTGGEMKNLIHFQIFQTCHWQFLFRLLLISACVCLYLLPVMPQGTANFFVVTWVPFVRHAPFPSTWAHSELLLKFQIWLSNLLPENLLGCPWIFWQLISLVEECRFFLWSFSPIILKPCSTGHVSEFPLVFTSSSLLEKTGVGR